MWTLGLEQHKLHKLLPWFWPTPMAAAKVVSLQIVATIKAVSPQILNISSLKALILQEVAQNVVYLQLTLFHTFAFI